MNPKDDGGKANESNFIKLPQERFEKAFQSNVSLMVISDLDTGRFLDINQTFLNTLGYRRDEVIGKTAKELNLFVDPTFRDKVILEMRQNGKTRSLDAAIRDKEGNVRWGIFHVDLLTVDGTSWVMTTMQDITDMKQMEQEIRELNQELQERIKEKIAETRLIDQELKTQIHLSNILFEQPLLGIFFMMLDEPLPWNENMDQEQALDYVFSHQRITRIN